MCLCCEWYVGGAWGRLRREKALAILAGCMERDDNYLRRDRLKLALTTMRTQLEWVYYNITLWKKEKYLSHTIPYMYQNTVLIL